MDENEKHMAGVLPSDPFADAKPVNAKALEIEESRVKVITEREMMLGAEKRANTPAEKNALTTGHYELDRYTGGGFRSGFIWVVGAETNWGKSSWAISVADENISLGRRVLIVSAEDDESIYGDRLMLRRSRVSADRFDTSRLSIDELARVSQVAREARDAPVFVSVIGKSFDRAFKNIQAIVKLEGIQLVIIDYLQALTTSKRTKDRREEINHLQKMARDCVKTAGGPGTAGLVLSQLTIDKKRSGPPGKYDIRESQDVTNGAEVVALGFTPDKDIYGDDPGCDAHGLQLQREVTFAAGQRYMLLAKNKKGRKDIFVEMSWDDHSACFNRVVDPEIERFEQLHDELGCDEWDAR